MEQMHIKNMLKARDEAIHYLNIFIEAKQEEYLKKDITTDNTNSKIIYYYENLKGKDQNLSVKKIDINTLNANSLKEALEKCYPKKYLENLNLKGKNNIPLDLNNEFMLNLSIKVGLGEKLYPIVDTEVPEDDEKKEKYIYTSQKKLFVLS